MGEVPKIVLPHGGYRKLVVFRKSDVVYEGTVAFCRRFLRGFAAGCQAYREDQQADCQNEIAFHNSYSIT